MTELDKALDELLSNNDFSTAVDNGDLSTILKILFNSKTSGIVEYFIDIIINEDSDYFNRNLLNDATRLAPDDISNKSNRYSGLDIDNKRFSDNLKILHALRSVMIPEGKAEINSGMKDTDCYVYFYTTVNTQLSKLQLSETYLRIPFVGGALTYGYTIPTENCYSKAVYGVFQNLPKEDQHKIASYLCQSINAFYDFAVDTVRSYLTSRIKDKK